MEQTIWQTIFSTVSAPVTPVAVLPLTCSEPNSFITFLEVKQFLMKEAMTVLFLKSNNYDSTDGVSGHGASPSPPSSLTYVHRCIGSRNATRQTLSDSAKLTYLSVYDSRDGVPGHGSSPSPPSSLTYVHRWIGSRHETRQTLPTSVKLTYLSVYDSRDDVRCLPLRNWRI